MKRWEAVTTFAIVAWVLATLYLYLAAIVARSVVTIPSLEFTFLVFWFAPSLLLLALSISADIWRRDHIVTDALVLTPICFAAPAFATVVFLVVACAGDNCSSL